MVTRISRSVDSYVQLIKPPQTAMLVLTGLTGYLSASGPPDSKASVPGLLATLFLTVSGSTMLNMVIDRGIDTRMRRTAGRPLPLGLLNPGDVLAAGAVLSGAGLAWATSMCGLYGVLLFLGWFVNVAVYSLALKRRTAWSILWGGVSGGMPILAGRALALGRIDWIGMLLALSILLWIPAHIMTFNMKYLDDYRRAGVPTFPSRYGFHVTRWTVAVSSFGAVLAIGLGSLALGLAGGFLWILAGLSAGVFGLALVCLIRPSEKRNSRLFSLASLYMAGAMLLLILGS